ncbi:MAG: hypothetical protein OEL89_00060 [Candidatus Peregrinibacteria bacterium]|nr:hypothetical protein [Candidatus Peregrinibacteria bacterium]
MTLSTSLANKTQSNGVIFKGGNGRTRLVRSNGSDIFLTAIVTAYGETNPDVDLAGAGEPVSGVIICEYLPYAVDLSNDSDDPYADNKYLGMYIPEDGDELYLTVATASSIAKDMWFKASGGFIVTSAKADALGVCLEAITGSSGAEQIALCRWGVDA